MKPLCDATISILEDNIEGLERDIKEIRSKYSKLKKRKMINTRLGIIMDNLDHIVFCASQISYIVREGFERLLINYAEGEKRCIEEKEKNTELTEEEKVRLAEEKKQKEEAIKKWMEKEKKRKEEEERQVQEFYRTHVVKEYQEGD